MNDGCCTSLPGYSGFLWAYDEAVAAFERGATFVEVGVGIGHSLSHLIRRRRAAGHTGPTYAVDPFAGTARNGEQQEALGGTTPCPGDFGLFLRNMQVHAPDELEHVRIIRAPSVSATHLFANLSLDMVLIDGDHTYEEVYSDIHAWWPKVKIGGWLVGDDYEPRFQGVIDAVHEFFGPRFVEVRGNTWRVRL